jgi:hypothetical protein
VVRKFVPITVRVKSGPPAVVDVGERLEFVGTGLLIVKESALDEPLPGVTTVTWAVPGVVMSVAGMAALTRLAETKVVVRSAPFHCTTDPLTNPVPFTVSVNAAVPAVRDVGLMLVIVAASACPEESAIVRMASAQHATTSVPGNR